MRSSLASHPAKISVVSFFFVSVILLANPGQISAERVNDDEMMQVCTNWLSLQVLENGNWGGSQSPKIIDTKEIYKKGILLGRCYDIAPNGFVVVPILKELPPVKASSDNCRVNFDDPEGIGPLIRDVLFDRIERFRENLGSLDFIPERGNSDLDLSHRQLWNDYLLEGNGFTEKFSVSGIQRTESGPLLTTTWHQSYPYYNLCPMGDGGRCVVGCVATAAAQIMRFWEWPLTGEGYHIYYWNGDYSCSDAGTPGQTLSADFSDPYAWDNDPANLAEICYEVGVAFNMDYGRCGSGTWTDMAVNVFPSYFKYKSNINKQSRSSYDINEWFDIIREEIDAGRPMQYKINSHSIVCDGYRETGGLLEYHMNYGWGGSGNAWYTLDHLYCPWDGCSPSVEYLIRNIEPRAVSMSADETFGQVSLTVSFTGESELAVNSWAWDFGDGHQADNQFPTHTYETAGIYDVSLEISSGGDLRRTVENNFIIVIADSMIAGNVAGDQGQSVPVPVYFRNTVPLKKMVIPIKYIGDLPVKYDSISTLGCRAEGFLEQVHNIGGGFLAVELSKVTEDLAPGTGAAVNIYFTVQEGGTTAVTQLELSDIGSYKRMFYGDLASYPPDGISGSIQLPLICGDPDNNKSVNILDIVYLINYLYKSGPEPISLGMADVNVDLSLNILDIVYLINHIYKNGPEAGCS